MAKTKRSSRGKRYTPAQRAKILSTAKKEKLTGAQVRKRFGVSTLTFYRWRGPVRKRRGRVSANGQSGSGSQVDIEALRREVRAGIQRVLPQVIREEVSLALGQIFGRTL